ncbi:hypothetical protein IAU60_003149 [Kwoniella sp. DSM 27419]
MTTAPHAGVTWHEDDKAEIEMTENLKSEEVAFDFDKFEGYSADELNILDRNNVANAKIAGMTKDLHLTGLDYNNLVFYVFCQIPVGFVLARFPAATVLAIAVVFWGAVSLACGFTHNYAQMSGLRFLVGVCEAPFFPGAVFILSSFYTRKELALRIAIMYSGNSLSNGFGSILAAAIISGMNGKGGLHGKARFLSEEQRRLAGWRVAGDAAGEADEGDQTSIKKGLRLILKDWKQMFISCVQSFSYFFPSIVASLGFGTNQTLLMSGPPYFFAFFASIAVAWSSTRFNERAYHIAVPMVLSVIGNILAITLPLSNIGGRYFAMFLMTLGTYCAFNLGFAWVASTIPRPRIKRSAALSLINGLGNASHFFTPYMFPSSDSPRYRSGGIALAVFCVATVCTALTIKYTLIRQNKKMREMDEADETYTGSLEGIPRGYVFPT